MKEKSKIEYLIRAENNASIRTRRVLIILNIATVVLIISFFNLRFSWFNNLSDYYNFNSTQIDNSELNFSLDSTNTIVNNQLDIIANFESEKVKYLKGINDNLGYSYRRSQLENNLGDDFEFIDISLIGTKIFVQDIPILGGIALVILLTWFYYTVRRERGILKYIVTNYSDKSKSDYLMLAFYGISFNSIYNTIISIDNPYTRLTNFFIGINLLFLTFLPSAAIGFIVAMDIYESRNEMNFHILNKKNDGESILQYCSLFDYLSDRNRNSIKGELLNHTHKSLNSYFDRKYFLSIKTLGSLYENIRRDHSNIATTLSISENAKNRILKKLENTIYLLELINELPTQRELKFLNRIGVALVTVNVVISILSYLMIVSIFRHHNKMQKLVFDSKID